MKLVFPLLPALLLAPVAALCAADVRTETWTEKWPDKAGQLQTITITAEVWTEPFQADLDADGKLHIPAREKPYYLDGPLVMKSGQKLTADAKAEIRLKPGTNTCMVRNEHIVGFAEKPVSADAKPDTDISIEGGIWTTFGEGNTRGHSSKQAHVHGTHGVILLQNVRRVTVRNITVRRSKAFAVHLANVRDFTVDGVTLEEHGRDGMHVNGPASDGIIRNVSGVSHDDTVALNAWEWKNYAPSFGAIHHIIIEDIRGAPDGIPSANSIRLLSGVKRFSDGTTLDCPIRDITIRRITDIRDFKLYDQPNLEVGREKDFSIGVGTLKNLRFENLTFHRPGSIQVHAHTDGLVVSDVKLNFPPRDDFRLIELGPKSQTYRHGGDATPGKWVEIFSPDLDCCVRNVSVTGVRLHDAQADLPIEQIVRVIEQKPNRDYPKTTPKGGTGKAIWIR